ncbi:Cyclin_N-domain-containing protein [Fragilariopsis cylindrus CCMP1102]|uniref:Cyclin_N-domain-containing protein n=1 Tax=Fragilariopsis cylindrus CCMP1102 TaxID=635003 RepID=A0A1E7G024_9STRA|nr:Cyclin_N-domain-containing protein [Fragilariopsis cylindrus CCMP1102]|eukprot:OEU23714.1 Cyclin_N-domain-containing protein [Fragilariopsis cylindrus CCMP1102]
MVSTRADRKRTSGEISHDDVISGGVKTRNQLTGNVEINSNDNNIFIDSEPSLLPPKTKRRRASSSSSSSSGTTGKAEATATAAQSKKTRALKPVAANVNRQKKTSANAKTVTKAKSVTKAKATVKTKAIARKSSSSSSSSSSSNEKKCLKRKAGTKIVPCESKSHDKVQLESSSVDTASSGFVKRSRRRSIKLSGGQKGVEPDDIDARDKNDPNSVTDYVEDMYEHFFRKEEGTSVSRCYMGRPVHGVDGVDGVGKVGLQPHINENMRCILVDWLIEVHYKFKLFPETLYLTANILDRFLSKTEESVVKRDLQLVGVTALLISAKYEEITASKLLPDSDLKRYLIDVVTYSHLS